MKTTQLMAAVCGVLLWSALGCSGPQKEGSTSQDSNVVAESGGDTTAAGQTGAHADIANTKPDTTGSGSADFVQKPNSEVELTLNVTFPKKANQSVAVHLHEHGACGDAGKEAHGHWNPTNEPHGKWGSGAFHSGDIGNVQLDANGSGSLTLSTNRWTIGGDEKTNILNRAIIVHSGVDDYKTQPTGNAGSRIGCGVIMSK